MGLFTAENAEIAEEYEVAIMSTTSTETDSDSACVVAFVAKSSFFFSLRSRRSLRLAFFSL